MSGNGERAVLLIQPLPVAPFYGTRDAVLCCAVLCCAVLCCAVQVNVAEVMANFDQLDGEWDLTGEKAKGAIKMRLQ